MESGIENLAGLVRDMNIAFDKPRDRGREPPRSTHLEKVSLRVAIGVLLQVTNRITSQAQSVGSPVDDVGSADNLPIAKFRSLRGSLTKITSNLRTTIDALDEATERSIIIHLRSLGGRSAIGALLSRFDGQIREIIREVLNNTSDLEVLWRVAEKCYKEASSRDGILHADDSDFDSEEYYEHEDRLDLNENHDASFQKQPKQNDKAKRKRRQSWTDFWIDVLNDSPAGPTLFYTPASSNAQLLDFGPVPKYLFRTFDKYSSRSNNESVIASMASTGSLENSRTDILKLDRDIATESLEKHLNKPCFVWEKSDNLVSWTSSLLFAIQYAVWMLGKRGCRSYDIHICAVDTRAFPPGQFAQDIWLLEKYRANATQIGGKIQSFFDFRLQREDYYNGEYLSQGVLNHTGRSCIVSLEQLIQAGLYELYPEFEDVEGNTKWAKRVKELRQNWSEEQETTDREIELALGVWHNCFARFDPCDIASILLTFKNRRFTRPEPTGK